MAIDGAVEHRVASNVVITGGVLFIASKVLKYWAIASLGTFWTFRVIVVPGAALVDSGPYRWLRHPNYVAVVGELIGFAVLVNALIAGPLAVLLFGYLLRRRVVAEEAALADSRN
jgi:methyltransferase